MSGMMSEMRSEMKSDRCIFLLLFISLLIPLIICSPNQKRVFNQTAIVSSGELFTSICFCRGGQNNSPTLTGRCTTDCLIPILFDLRLPCRPGASENVYGFGNMVTGGRVVRKILTPTDCSVPILNTHPPLHVSHFFSTWCKISRPPNVCI